MPKRKRDDVVSSGSSEVYIPEEVVQEILEKLAVKSLLRFKVVSKTWKVVIESRPFQERHLRHQHKSRDPSILVFEDDDDDDHDGEATASVRTLSVGETSLSMEDHYHYQLHTWTLNYHFQKYVGILTTRSCDGLICLYSNFWTYVINPATRWYRKVPEARCQARVEAILDRYFIATEEGDVPRMYSFPTLGFGKDNITGIYKLVWLCSSTYLNRDNQNINTCEVFSFDNNNTWNDVIVSCPHPVIHYMSPTHTHGFLHWLIDAPTETQILSFDLHTETFKVITKLPVVVYPPNDHITLCTLNNCLSLSEDKGDIQTIWSFNQDNNTWDKTYSINLRSTLSNFDEEYIWSVPPITSLSGDRLLLYDLNDGEDKLVLYNYRLNSFSKFFKAPYSLDGCISYYQSLVTLP